MVQINGCIDNMKLHKNTYTWSYAVGYKTLHSFEFTFLLRCIYYTSKWLWVSTPNNSIAFLLQKLKLSVQFIWIYFVKFLKYGSQNLHQVKGNFTLFWILGGLRNWKGLGLGGW